MMSAEQKKKRGCNYTNSERDMLLDIVKGYISIIENKATTSDIIKKKQNAWLSVSKHYNAIATSGPRTWMQLRHLYENLKQRRKKSFVPENRQQYDTMEAKREPPEMRSDDSYDSAALYCDGDQDEITDDVDITEQTTLDGDPNSLDNNRTTLDSDPTDNKESKNIKKASIKEQYFKIKLGNAKLERKYLIQKHKLEIELLKTQISLIKKEK